MGKNYNALAFRGPQSEQGELRIRVIAFAAGKGLVLQTRGHSRLSQHRRKRLHLCAFLELHVSWLLRILAIVQRPEIRQQLLLVLLVPAITRAQATQAAAPGTIVIGHTDSIWSPTLKENRKYIVYTPPGYAPSSYQARAYPVLYLLDGDAHFHSVTGLVQFFSTGINGTYVLPEMIVVAISKSRVEN